MNETRTARIPYELDDTTLNGIVGVVMSLPSVAAILRTDAPPLSSHDSPAIIVTYTDADALVRDVCAAFHDEPTDPSRVAFND
jgi:hypothetical protein